MEEPGSRDPLFVIAEADRLTRHDVSRLAAGRLAAVRVPGLLAPARCHALTAALSVAAMDRYDENRVFPVVTKYGPAINDHRRDGELHPDYWEAAREAEKGWSALGVPDSPRELCLSAFREAWPGVAPGRRRWQEMHVGIVREINNGLQVHFDDAAREWQSNLLEVDLIAQLAFNVYIAVPPGGAETVVWRRRWQPGDERHHVPGGYGYRESVVDGAESLTVRPGLGEALLFDPRNYHTVRPAVGGRRISVGCFVGLTDDGRLLLWS